MRVALDVQGRVGLPVRIGLHTGTAVERDGDYFGRTLNRAARIMSAGHGGQILVSDVTAGLIRDDAAELVDLGEHRFAGVDNPIHLWQLGGREFPPLRTSTALAGNLPHPLDTFIGRGDELGMLSGLIATHRLVTVVGVGGMGKTRLVIAPRNSNLPGVSWSPEWESNPRPTHYECVQRRPARIVTSDGCCLTRLL